MKLKTTILFFVLGAFQINAQCAFDPIVEGDILFCPNQTEGELICNISDADSYQWFSRPFSGGSETPIAGATDYILSVTNNDILNYFSVDVTIDGCTERSPEVLLDGLFFILPVVETTGDYVFDGSNFLICEGDSMFMTLMNPYDTNITWYRDGTPIPGENDQTLEVSSPGSYTVSGAPSICPDFIQFLGLDLVVAFNTDPNECELMSVGDNEKLNGVKVYPNPTNDFLNLQSPYDLQIASVVLYDAMGRKVMEHTELSRSIDVSKLTSGIYFLTIRTDSGRVTKKVIKE